VEGVVVRIEPELLDSLTAPLLLLFTDELSEGLLLLYDGLVGILGLL
jgi:hypothetical protein